MLDSNSHHKVSLVTHVMCYSGEQQYRFHLDMGLSSINKRTNKSNGAWFIVDKAFGKLLNLWGLVAD